MAEQLSGGTGSGGDGFSDPPSLDLAFWSGERGFAADGSALRGVDREWTDPLVRLPCADEWPADHIEIRARG